MKKIVILGSTGSIGKSLLKIINKDKKSFNIKLLTAHKNYKQLLRQAKLFNVKKVILTDKKTYNLKKQNFTKNNISVFNNFSDLGKILTNKVDYVMSAIVGLDGLEPTLKLIKFTKNIAIANKESIICGWNLIKKELKKNNTEFIPVDSEHFSLWYALRNNSTSNIEKLYLTASGGPLLNVPRNKFNKLKISKIINHPNWRMGAKISVDSSTMINKVFEVIEAKKIFELNYDQISIYIHPKSYVHAIIKFKDGMIKIIAHDTTMEIPIFNTLNMSNAIKIKTKKLNLMKLNSLNFSNIDKEKFTCIKVLKKLPSIESLFETVLVSANDQLVNLFLKKKISYTELIQHLLRILSKREFVKYKYIAPKKITDILELDKYIKSQINQNVKN